MHGEVEYLGRAGGGQEGHGEVVAYREGPVAECGVVVRRERWADDFMMAFLLLGSKLITCSWSLDRDGLDYVPHFWGEGLVYWFDKWAIPNTPWLG